MKNLFQKYILSILTIFGLTSCYSLYDLHEAKVLEENENRISFNGGYFIPVENQQGNLGLDINLNYRRGLGRKTEFGLWGSILMKGRIDIKREFYASKSEEFYMASGFNLEMAAFRFDSRFSLPKFELPCYFSYHPEKWLSFYGNLKLSYQMPNRFALNNGLLLLSSNSGLRIGNKVGLILEISHIPTLNKFWNVPFNYEAASQLHGGLFYRF